MSDLKTKEATLKEIIKEIESTWTTVDNEDGFQTVEDMIRKTDAIAIIEKHFLNLQ
jgi:hypothetical protein